MSVLVSIQNLSKSYGARTLFHNLSFGIHEKEKVALVGTNGSGKSTLLEMIAGIDHADSGEIVYQKGITLSTVPQTPVFSENLTIASYLKEQTSLDQEHVFAKSLSEFSQALGRKINEDSLLSSLSGGMKKVLSLIRALAQNPDLLILDEPTNHLDLQTIFWLEKKLMNYPRTLILVSHDRLFLERIANKVIALQSQLKEGYLSIKGTYLDYLNLKEDLLHQQRIKQESLKNIYRNELDWLSRGPKARTTKQNARINRAKELEMELQDLSSRNKKRELLFSFEEHDSKPKRILEAKRLTKKTAEKTLFENLDLFLGLGERVGILGFNLSGKSTLLKVLAGKLKADSGSISYADNLDISYFEQNKDLLKMDLSLQQNVCLEGDQIEWQGRKIHIRKYLEQFLFKPDQFLLKVSELSGGEQSRLLIAKLMLQKANLLILDEPTNDLDLETLEVLQDCLIDFKGSILLVSHDRYFINQVCTKLIAFHPYEEGKMEHFASYEQWEKWFEGLKKPSQNKNDPLTKERTEAYSPSLTKKRLSYMEQREFDSMEEKILTLESKLQTLEAQLTQPSLNDPQHYHEISKQLEEMKISLEALYQRWAELEGKLK